MTATDQPLERVDKVVLVAYLTTYDAQGRPVSERQSAQVTVFRAAVPDVWAMLDRAIFHGASEDSHPRT